MRVIVGTRGSPLALTQTNTVLADLRRLRPEVEFVVKTIKTTGDLAPDKPMRQMPRGLFAKELELALAAGEIDFAVHSFKDLPTELAAGFAIAAVSEREDPRDVLITPGRESLARLPQGSRLGTSSPRRLAQIKAYRPDLRVLPIRGNVGTRMEKARSGQYDGIVLAAAGLKRLGMEREITEYIDPSVSLPAVGQGVLALETRSDDSRTRDLVSQMTHQETQVCVSAEMGVLRKLGGGCRTPIAAYAVLQGDQVFLRGMVASADGTRLVRAETRGSVHLPEAVGIELAGRLIDLGAAALLEAQTEQDEG